MSRDALEAVRRIADSGADADDVLRALVAALVREPEIVWAGILFMEEGALTLGPEAGVPDPTRRLSVPVTFQDAIVGELAVDGSAEPAFLARVARADLGLRVARLGHERRGLGAVAATRPRRRPPADGRPERRDPSPRPQSLRHPAGGCNPSIEGEPRGAWQTAW